jgi:hypothetical protein
MNHSLVSLFKKRLAGQCNITTDSKSQIEQRLSSTYFQRSLKDTKETQPGKHDTSAVWRRMAGGEVCRTASLKVSKIKIKREEHILFPFAF